MLDKINNSHSEENEKEQILLVVNGISKQYISTEQTEQVIDNIIPNFSKSNLINSLF